MYYLLTINHHFNTHTAQSEQQTSRILSSFPSRLSTMSNSDQENSPPRSKRARTMSDILSESLQQLHITGTSQENPIDIAGPSQRTPQPFSFILKLKHAGPLKLSMDVLSDPEINEQELLRIDVDENGFNITVENSCNNSVCHLFLKPSEFEYTRPIQGKIVNLPELSRKLKNVEDGSALHVFHFTGCQDLIFATLGITPARPEIFVRAGTTQFSVLLHENNAEIPKFPDISPSCEVAIPYDDMIAMLGCLLQQAPYQVFVEITENTAKLRAGQGDERWTAEYPMQTVAGSQGTEPGKTYCAFFEWAHDEWLDNTVHLEGSFVVSLHTEEPTYIVLRFILGDFGYLEFIGEAGY